MLDERDVADEQGCVEPASGGFQNQCNGNPFHHVAKEDAQTRLFNVFLFSLGFQKVGKTNPGPCDRRRIEKIRNKVHFGCLCELIGTEAGNALE